MRRAWLIVASLLIISTAQNASAVPALKTVKPGSTCTKINQIQVLNSLKYTCIKSGKKLIWSTGVQVKSPISKPSPTPVPSNKPTPSVTPTPTPTPTATKTPEPLLAIGPRVEPPENLISIFNGPRPTGNRNAIQSFEVSAPLVPAKAGSNLKLWIYDPENKSQALGSPGIYIQKAGGNWYFVGKDRNDGGFDTKFEPGNYTIDIVEPNGNQTKYDRGRYSVSVDNSGELRISGLKPNSAGYYTVTAVLKGVVRTKQAFAQTSKCQLPDKTGSWNMSNGFPRAEGRLPNRGVVKALIIPVEFTDLLGSGSPATNYLSMAKGTADFYYKQSQQTVRFEFTTLPNYINLNVPVGSFNLGSYNGGDPYGYFQAGLNAVENLIDISNFDIVYVLPPVSVKYNQIAYGPAFPGDINSNNYQNATGRVLNGSVGGADAWQNLPGANWKWMAHETGHTFGLYDWYTLDGTNPYGPWDIMSLNWSTEAIELNAWNRYISGWLADSQITCLDSSEITNNSMSFKIETIAVDSANKKSVMIKLGETRIMVIEARATAGLDQLKDNQTGLLVYVVDTSIPTIKGIAKTYSRSGISNDLREAPLRSGEMINVEGIQIKAGTRSGNEFEVIISK